MPGMARPSAHPHILTYSILTAATLVVAYPLLFIVLGSFATTEEANAVPFLPMPHSFSLRTYQAILTTCRQEGCVPVSGAITAARVLWYVGWTLLVSIFGGYVFARLNFPLKRWLFVFFLSGLMVPPLLTVLPQYILLARVPLFGDNDVFGRGGHGLINQWPALGVFGLVNVLALFLVKQNYEMLPPDYEEAARMDGAGTLRIIFQIYLPMLRPALVAVAVLECVEIWNDYFAPLVFVGGNADVSPIALTIQRLAGGGRNGDAAAVLMCIPTVLLYLLLQRYFVQGLAGAGLKG
jgi:multiple sugar transport system permease protein